ncbi:MAG: RsmB/NOP family class I SAM-dependent RNA methyltransferase [Pseudomonadota bacterium]
MTPAARAAAAIEVLDQWLEGDRIEPVLRQWGRANRYAGSGDRRAIGDIAYECLRRKPALAALSGASGGRGLVHGWAVAAGIADRIFTGEGHAPPPLTAAEVIAPQDLPDPARLCYPDWLDRPLRAALGAAFEPAMAALCARAPVDLRVNRIKATEESARAALSADAIAVQPVDGVPGALRAAPQTRLTASKAYGDGLVEVQDAASQAAALACAPEPGMTVLDYCAGGGGKALALASLMGGKGRILAHDVNPRRMKDLPARAARAGAEITLATTGELTKAGPVFDLVLVDAPCSGSGTWRRDPEAKWHLTDAILHQRIADQKAAFAAALGHLKPGGRIAYATCSVLRTENQDQITAFMTTWPQLSLTAEHVLLPGAPSDGFYCAVFQT